MRRTVLIFPAKFDLRSDVRCMWDLRVLIPENALGELPDDDDDRRAGKPEDVIEVAVRARLGSPGDSRAGSGQGLAMHYLRHHVISVWLRGRSEEFDCPVSDPLPELGRFRVLAITHVGWSARTYGCGLTVGSNRRHKNWAIVSSPADAVG